jgi:phosphoserine phosphatase
VLDRLASAQAKTGEPAWLSPGEACDIPLAGEPGPALREARQALAPHPFDVNVVATTGRRKRLLVADMDSTLIQQECIDELAAEVGLGKEVAAITERAMRGEIAFEPALRERVALLKGLPAATIAKVLEERIVLMPGADTLMATMRQAGAYTALISGGFTAFAEPIARRLRADEYRANVLVERQGCFTGEVAEPILGRAAKAQMLQSLSRRLGLLQEDTLAVGDGANDADIVRSAGLGVAFHAKPALRAAASAVIDHADLTGLLFLQGYRREEFAGPAPL